MHKKLKSAAAAANVCLPRRTRRASRLEPLTSLHVHHIDSLYEQGGVGLCVLHKHQQQLQGRLHHQTELHRKKSTLSTPTAVQNTSQ